MNVQRVKVVEKDSQLQSSKNQNLKNARIIKDLRQDNDRLKEELRLLRREASSSEDKNRRNQLELEVLRERQSATKLAYRLQSQNQALSQSSISPQRKNFDRSTSQENRSRSLSGSSSYYSNSDSKPDVIRACPYSRPRSRSRSESHSRGPSKIRSNNDKKSKAFMTCFL